MQKIKKNYTIMDLKNDKNDRMGDRRLDLLLYFIEKKNCTLGMEEMFKKELEEMGIIIYNKSYIRYSITYNSKEDISLLEHEIINYAREQQLLVEELKIDLDYDKYISFLCKYNNWHSLREEIIVRIEDDNNKKEKVKSYIEQLDLKEGRTLIITDPYLISGIARNNTYNETYAQFLSDILGNDTYKIKLYIPDVSSNLIFDKLDQSLTKRIERIRFENCHDRFWICPESKNGFLMGTSLNGIGKKLCYIDRLSTEDVLCILEALNYNTIVS